MEKALDTKMLIIIGLGVLSVILLVLMFLQKGKKSVQAQGAYPPGPIPPTHILLHLEEEGAEEKKHLKKRQKW